MPAKRPQDWTAEEKLQAVVKAADIPEAELGAFLSPPPVARSPA